MTTIEQVIDKIKELRPDCQGRDSIHEVVDQVKCMILLNTEGMDHRKDEGPMLKDQQYYEDRIR